MLKRRFASVFLTVLALAICTGTVYGQSLSWIGNVPNNDLQLVYVQGLASQPGLSFTASVTSGSVAGFTVSTVNRPPAWLTVALPTTPPGDTSQANNLTISTTGAALTAHSISSAQMGVTFGLTPSDASPDVMVTVDLLWLTAVSPFSAPSTTVSLGTYHNNTPSGSVQISVASPITTLNYTLDNSTPLPPWLTAATIPGTVIGGAATTIAFSTIPALLNALAPITYNVPVKLDVAGCGSCAALSLNLTLYVQPQGSTEVVTVTGRDSSNAVVTGTSTTIPSWTTGTTTSYPVTIVASPTNMPFTAQCVTTSSNTTISSPTACSITLAGETWAPGATATGLAGSFGVILTGNFDKNYFDLVSNGAKYNDWVAMAITINPQTGQSQTFTYTITMPAPTAYIAAVNPSSMSMAPNSGSSIVTLTGTGFVSAASMKGGWPTVVFTGTVNTTMTVPSTITYVVNSSTQITLTVPDSALPATGSLWIAVANQTSASTPAPPVYNSHAAANAQPFTSITIVTTPVITNVTSSASYVQPASGLQTVSPYELISIFGTNFDSNTIDLAKADPVKGQFSTTLGTGTGGHTNLQVGFSTLAAGPYTYAPLLFATGNQINAIVPSALTFAPTSYYITVFSGANASNHFQVSVVASAPGVFTSDSSGYGQAAAIDASGTNVGLLNGTSNPASVGDIISLYVTGLGVPDAVTTTNTLTYSSSCITPAAYLTATGVAPGSASTVITTIDGAIISPQYLGFNGLGAGKLPPCFGNASNDAHLVTVKFACPLSGNTPVAIDTTSSAAGVYAGFVANSVAGLYQVNLPIPVGLAAVPTNCPVQVFTGASLQYSSQSTGTIAISGQ